MSVSPVYHTHDIIEVFVFFAVLPLLCIFMYLNTGHEKNCSKIADYPLILVFWMNLVGLMNLVKWMVVVNKKILEILVTW